MCAFYAWIQKSQKGVCNLTLSGAKEGRKGARSVLVVTYLRANPGGTKGSQERSEPGGHLPVSLKVSGTDACLWVLSKLGWLLVG